ncbi:thioredoxin domain-containing protein [uncultured Sphingorhabdus sp.]|uniref:thioredoxin domain-containing protein n=1 Tax=uncultured Sphingorhabdus sp. TaxID=1686106 RepID=UPI0026021522|nr:thioredoxin domain-containing protein [uncultured Sphingorhabdus sp.]HMS19572.1 thioredoxin domain-containing protein [Sphingorhabdus sp.]
MQRSNLEAKMATRFPTVFRTSLILIAAATLGSAALIAAPAKTNWLLAFSTTAKGSHVIGNPAAPTKLVEYASYTCGHCAHFEIDDAPQIKNQFVATGKVSFEIRNLVRDPMDLTAAMLARCGGKGRFFGNHRHLMATQAQWANGSMLGKATIALLEAKNIVGFMQGAYTELGLDKIMAQRGVTAAQAKVCLADKAAFNAVIAMTDEATEKLKINSTPTLLVNGKVIEGHDFATIKTHLAP